MISYWHDTVVCLSVRTFVCLCCLSVMKCIMALRVGEGVWKLYRHVPRKAPHLFTSWDTFALVCIVQPQLTAQNRTAEISASGRVMGSVVTSPWVFQTRHFRRFNSFCSYMYVVYTVRSAFLAIATLLADNRLPVHHGIPWCIWYNNRLYRPIW